MMCESCGKYSMEKDGALDNLYFCVGCGYTRHAQIEQTKVKNMAEKKLPSYRLVIGKKNVGTLWTAKSKGGMDYHSGELDVTALREALKEGETKVKDVRVSRDGATAKHEVIRVAMFDAMRKQQGCPRALADYGARRLIFYD
jgi:hypothetical protein